MQVNNLASGGYDIRKVGKQDFLKLFVTQLQYQNPLDPIKNDNFISQLAQFSSLEELVNIKDEISKLTLKENDSTLSYVNLIGRTIRYGAKDEEGTVTSVSFEGNKVYLNINNDKTIDIKDIYEIK